MPDNRYDRGGRPRRGNANGRPQGGYRSSRGRRTSVPPSGETPQLVTRRKVIKGLIGAVFGVGALQLARHQIFYHDINMQRLSDRREVNCAAYRRGEDKFLLVPNAANKDKDVAWIKDHISGDVTFKDVSDQVAQIALQGPESKEIITKVCNEADLPVKYYSFVEGIQVAGCAALVSRTGYTGEFGYEIYVSPADVVTVWNALLDNGVVPCGLGARDTLRLEASMPLYGHELTDDIDPLTAGLQFAIKTDNHEFIGKQAMLDKHASAGVTRVGLKVTGRGIVREHETIYSGDKQVGQTTSGTMCPTVGMAVAMAYVNLDCAEVGTALEVEVRGRRVPVEVIPMPFYTAKK